MSTHRIVATSLSPPPSRLSWPPNKRPPTEPQQPQMEQLPQLLRQRRNSNRCRRTTRRSGYTCQTYPSGLGTPISETCLGWVRWLIWRRESCSIQIFLFFIFQKFGPILDVEIIFNERGSKVSRWLTPFSTFFFPILQNTRIILGLRWISQRKGRRLLHTVQHFVLESK